MVHVNHIAKNNSVFSNFLAEIRDVKQQKDSMRFRRNLERMGEIMAYEISKTLEYQTVETETPLGTAQTSVLKEQPVIATILRAGLPLHIGILNMFDKAENAFIGAYRRHHKDNTFDVALEYLASPDLENKILILCDPMLASGSSLLLTYNSLISRSKPRHTHIVSAVASQQGLIHLKKNLNPKECTIWCGDIDEELTAQSYIVPGLGDAGDLAFGIKL
ncbi:MAG: uracil phosphoribosyltransferase [Sphingobacteriaceae bacterium]|nr:uracil phosphoribosyltransferase [Sphingobacteriaceae bacterium]